MSSSFPAARFPALPIGEKKGAADTVQEDADATKEENSDESLFERIVTGDEDALGILFRRYARVVWSVADRILRDKAEAEDVLQEVFLTVYRKAAYFDIRKGSPRALIIHMAYQRALTRRKYLASRHLLYDLADEIGGDETRGKFTTPSFYDTSLEAYFGRDELQNAIVEMSEAQRETLRLFFFEGYTLNEIAKKFGQSQGNVKHHYYRGLRKLRQYLPNRMKQR
jgi:RNA polymerase sigma-70 factor (ECF subfamily)